MPNRRKARRLARPSPYLRRVGVRDFPFEACSGLPRMYGRPACSPGLLQALSGGFHPVRYSAE